MDAKLNHSDLSALLAKEAGMSLVKAELLTKTVFDLIIEGLEQDGVVKINGLGTFKLTDVASRSSVNVNTGEKFEIKGHKKLVFTPADTLKECVNQPFAMFEPVEVDETYNDDADDENNDSVTEDNNLVEDVQVEENETAVDETAVAETEIEEKVAEQTEQITEEEQDIQAEIPVEQPVAEQPKRPEPVMVHVPKKEKKPFAVPEKKAKKSYKWVYITLCALFSVCALLFVLLFTPIVETEEVVKENVAVVAEQMTDAVTGATVDATSGATPQDKELAANEASIDAIVTETSEPAEYNFVITKELAALDLKNITVADTVLYDMADVWAEHKVVAHETLTRIALKYYGDKKLWPYIVKYNSLARPDDLRKGMKVLIPKLNPRS